MSSILPSEDFVFARLLSLAAVAAGSLFAPSLGAQNAPAPFHVTRRIPVTGDGGWDYVTFDTARSRIFIARSTRVQVVDANSGQLVGEIPNTGGVHGVALAYGLNKGYTSNGRDTTVTVFDFVSLVPSKTIHVTGANPDAILFDSATHRVFTFNGRGENTTAIDAVGDTVIGTLALGGKPETAVSDGAGHIFVNIENKGNIVEFDAEKLTVLHTYPLAPCEEPSGLALDLAHHRLFAGCGNKMMAVVDATNGHVIATPATDDGTDGNAFDPVIATAFSSNGAGTVSIVMEQSADKFVAESIPTERGARTMALDPKTHRLYLVTAGFNPPPAATAAQPRPRPSMIPGTFVVLVVGR
ncbi:MAG: YncE family protein [Gemmatimonadota bacterium]|nr:YncE family protein [Gemmatimonadota bacterium]